MAGKRLFDIAVSVCGLLVCFLPFVIISIAIRLDSAGPLFFTQMRLGRHGKLFRLYKFRTMTNRQRESDREVLPDNPEVTAVGRLLRRIKIDEFPQFFNVLKGDMAIVGPRPALPKQLDELNDVGKRRLEVRPGLTGLAQVHGNIYLSWPERWEYDADYVKRTSLCLDCWIMWRTFFVLLGGEERFLKPPKEEKKE